MSYSASQIRTIAIIAEGIPENMTRILIKKATEAGVSIIGPATVGGIKPGCFKIGNTGGMMDNILHSKLYRPGRLVSLPYWILKWNTVLPSHYFRVLNMLNINVFKLHDITTWLKFSVKFSWIIKPVKCGRFVSFILFILFFSSNYMQYVPSIQKLNMKKFS